MVPSDRVEILDDGCSLKLVIQEVAVEDEGTYSVEVGEHTSKAKLMVEGRLVEMPFSPGAANVITLRAIHFPERLQKPNKNNCQRQPVTWSN